MKRDEIRWALVTGASSGIGEELSRLLASKGINLIIHGRNEQRLLELSTELSKQVNIEIVVADLADHLQRMKVIEMIHKYVPELIVNNAGLGLYGEALTYTTAEQTNILEVNGNAVLQITLDAARTLISKGKKGVILNVASAAAFPIFPCFAVYAASKAFVVSLSESLDEETRSYGVRILASCPGMVSTQFRDRAGGSIQKSSGMESSMDVAFAAEQIWLQIEKENKVLIFNWLYRIMIFLVRYVLPKKWVAASVRDNINKRHPPRPLIKDP